MFKQLVSLQLLLLAAATGIQLMADDSMQKRGSYSDQNGPTNRSGKTTAIGQQQQQQQQASAKLNGSFMRLFDSLAKIHDTSLATLTQLDYFRPADKRELARPPFVSYSKPQKLLLLTPPPIPRPLARPTVGSNRVVANKTTASTTTTVVGAVTSTTPIQIHQSKPVTRVRDSLDQLMRRFSLWLEQLGRRFSEMLHHLRIANDGSASNKHPKKTVASKQQPFSDRDLPSSPRLLSKRDLNQAELVACNPMGEAMRNRCELSERLISENLNYSVPASSDTIERSCKSIELLYAECWPKPTTIIADLSDQKTSFDDHNSVCPYETALAEPLMDRVKWMWSNLCLDRQFRVDYLNNLNCLRNWNLDKAQTACHSEYQLMQYNLNLPTKTATTTTTPSDLQQPPRLTTTRPSQELKPTSDANQQHQQRPPKLTGGDGETDLASTRELESKILCCMFDKFLKCVYKQALRDSCGPIGAQFVVNFMARIGPDDMKYICNSEPKKQTPSTPSTRQATMTTTTSIPGSGKPGRQPNQASSDSKRNSNLSVGQVGLVGSDRSPFIERNYCSEPRVATVLYRMQLFGGDRYPSSGSHMRSATRQRPNSTALAGTIAPFIYKNEFQMSPNNAANSRLLLESSNIRTILVAMVSLVFLFTTRTII